MARRDALHLSTKAWLVASAVAPAIAVVVASVLLFVLDTLPFMITTAQATATEQKVFGFTSFGDELLNATGGLLLDIILGPILAVPLGFVGASLFLLPAFLLVGRIQKAWTFIAAGAVAGLAHALIGIALARVDVFAWFVWLWAIYPMAVIRSLNLPSP